VPEIRPRARAPPARSPVRRPAHGGATPSNGGERMGIGGGGGMRERKGEGSRGREGAQEGGDDRMRLERERRWG
jgi:hypothetical protein